MASVAGGSVPASGTVTPQLAAAPSEVSGAPSVAGGDDSEDEILGTSTADQVLGRWAAFIRASGDELRTHATSWVGGRSRLPQVGVTHDESIEVEDEQERQGNDPEEHLALRSSPVGSAIKVLAVSVGEARLCVKEAVPLLKGLALFGESEPPEPEGGSTQTPASLSVEFAENLPSLVELRQLLDRCATVATHLLQQLAGLHCPQSSVGGGGENGAQTGSQVLPAVNSPVRPALDALGEVLAVLVTIDGLVLENAHFRRAFNSYSLAVAKASGATLGSALASGTATPAGASSALPELPAPVALSIAGELRELESIAAHNTFQRCLAHVAEQLRDLGPPAAVSALRDRLASYFRARLEESEPLGSAAVAKLELPSQSVVPWVCTFVLSATVWQPSKADSRIVADLWRMHRKSPLVVLLGRAAWCVGDFLHLYVPSLVEEAGLAMEFDDMPNIRRKQAARLDEGGFVREMLKSRSAVQVWLAGLDMSSKTLASGQVTRALKEANQALLRGLALALRVRASLEEYLVVHLREAVPVPRSCLAAVALGFCLLRSLANAPRSLCWAEISALLQRRTALRLHASFDDARSKLKTSRPADRAVADALDVALRSLYRVVGGARPEQWYFDVGAIALGVAGQLKFLAAGSDGLWRELWIMSTWPRHLERLCDTAWCFWVRDFLPELMAIVRDKPQGDASLPLLCAAFAAPLTSLLTVDSPLGRDYLQELRECLGNCVLEPLARAVEQDLRFSTHAVMEASTSSACSAPSDVALELLGLPPISLAPDVLVDLRDEVEVRLDKAFYDLGALAPQEAEAYGRMRALARERYGLCLIDGGLPSGTLDHSLDVIEIMRSIHLFAAQYSYSLHQQFFAQSANQGDAKIRTITVEHLAGSIRRHGAGTINTTVNYSYGFLRRKLEQICGFMADESVRSRLLADDRWLKDSGSVVSSASVGASTRRSSYTWARAVDTARAIRRLGNTGDGTPVLDKLRQVVTQIGNTLGYVRTVRSAGMRCVASGLPYVEPVLSSQPSGTSSAGNPPSLADSASAAACPTTVGESAAVADDASQSVRRCFEARTDYLHILAQVFGRALAGNSQTVGGSAASSPAGLFYLLVPALSLSFLDALLVGREVLTKRSVATGSSLRSNALCFDDGFAVGVACILRILGQEQAFQSLHWFDAKVPEEGAAPPSEAAAAVAAATLPGAEKSPIGGSRREMLERELGRLAATLEAASSLFGSTASSFVPPSGDAARGGGPATDGAEDAGGRSGADAVPVENTEIANVEN